MTYVGCIGGAVLIEDYVQQLKDAGFSDIVVVDTGADLNAYTEIGTMHAPHEMLCLVCLTTHTHTTHDTHIRAELLCARG